MIYFFILLLLGNRGFPSFNNTLALQLHHRTTKPSPLFKKVLKSKKESSRSKRHRYSLLLFILKKTPNNNNANIAFGKILLEKVYKMPSSSKNERRRVNVSNMELYFCHQDQPLLPYFLDEMMIHLIHHYRSFALLFPCISISTSIRLNKCVCMHHSWWSKQGSSDKCYCLWLDMFEARLWW